MAEEADRKRIKLSHGSQMDEEGQKFDDDSQLTTFQHSESSATSSSDIVDEDIRFFKIVTSGIYRDFVTESLQEEMDGIDNAQSDARYARKRTQMDKCFVSDASFSCLNEVSETSLCCYSCKMRTVCLECWTKCRRCNSCYLAVNRKSGLSDLSAANGNDDPIVDDLFALRSESRRLSVEENLFCAHKLRCHRLFSEHGCFTGPTSAVLLRNAAQNGYFFIDFTECVKQHHDSRVVRLVPLYVAEQLQIHIARQRDAFVPYETNLRSSGRTIATISSPYFVDDIFQNIRLMV